MIQAFYFQGIWIIGKKLNFYRWLFQICVHGRPAAVYFYHCGCCFIFSLEKGVLFVKPYTLKFLRILKKKTKLFHIHVNEFVFQSSFLSNAQQAS